MLWIETATLLAVVFCLCGVILKIEMKLSELKSSLDNIDSKLTEASAEILAEIQRLKDALGDVEIPADAQASLDAISAKATALADIIPNA